MSIKRFFAKTTSEALRKVRDSLGPEGVILSNRSVDGGIEILALHQDAISALIPSRVPAGPGALGAPRGPGAKVSSKPQLNAGATGSPYQAENFNSGNEGFSSPQRSGRYDATLYLNEMREAQQDRVVLDATPPLHGQSDRFDRASAMPPPLPGKRQMSGLPLRDSDRDRNGNEAARAGPPAAASAPGNNFGAKQGSRDEQHPQPPAKQRTKAVRNIAPGKKVKTETVDARALANEVAASVLNEIKSMRGTLEQKLASLSWNDQERRDPMRGQLLSRLLKTGFSEELARDLLDEMPAVTGEADGISYVKAALGGRLKTIGNEREILEKGGVYALVGPTGVGKTTTTAKLAARCVVRHGADKLALLTTDGYRIGGHEQLRIYGKILGVAVHAVRDKRDLALALKELRGKHLVLIDTVGVGQRDRMVAEQVAMLAGCGSEVKRLLLINAASNGYTLNEVAHAYRGDGLAGAIITKLDEAVILGGALDTAVRHGLPLYYVAQGQRVPEDLELADAPTLIDGALETPQVSSFDLPDEEIVLPMASGKQGDASLDRREISGG
jgi:flagellar biosynthesis protein FlhF